VNSICWDSGMNLLSSCDSEGIIKVNGAPFSLVTHLFKLVVFLLVVADGVRGRSTPKAVGRSRTSQVHGRLFHSE